MSIINTQAVADARKPALEKTALFTTVMENFWHPSKLISLRWPCQTRSIIPWELRRNLRYSIPMA